jgi:hypothetical protein
MKLFLSATMGLVMYTLTMACADRYDRTSSPSRSSTYSEPSTPSSTSGAARQGVREGVRDAVRDATP